MNKRVFMGLDGVNNLEGVGWLVSKLAPHVAGFRIGLELQTAVGGPQAIQFVHSRGGRVFYDASFSASPEEVARACRALVKFGVRMFSISCSGGMQMLYAARRAVDEEQERRIRKESTFIVGTTVHEEEPVCAAMAQQAEFDGITVASAQNIRAVRRMCGQGLFVIARARSSWAVASADTTPEQAILAGADWLMIDWRSLASGCLHSPLEAIGRINAEVEEALAARGGSP